MRRAFATLAQQDGDEYSLHFAMISRDIYVILITMYVIPCKKRGVLWRSGANISALIATRFFCCRPVLRPRLAPDVRPIVFNMAGTAIWWIKHPSPPSNLLASGTPEAFIAPARRSSGRHNRDPRTARFSFARSLEPSTAKPMLMSRAYTRQRCVRLGIKAGIPEFHRGPMAFRSTARVVRLSDPAPASTPLSSQNGMVHRDPVIMRSDLRPARMTSRFFYDSFDPRQRPETRYSINQID